MPTGPTVPTMPTVHCSLASVSNPRPPALRAPSPFSRPRVASLALTVRALLMLLVGKGKQEEEISLPVQHTRQSNASLEGLS